ncbi:MAG: ABC transporter substrate-binding protein [Dehalococcoidia bacterium]|nr:ABC transporter substrate-binding protein [Dehalococcoidia bacterium]
MHESNYWTKKSVGRRAVLRGSGLGIAGLAGAALIGCGSGEEAAPATAATAATAATGATPAPAATVTEAQKRGGYFKGIVAQGYNPTNIDPYTTPAGSVYNVQGNSWYESLIDPDLTNVDWVRNYKLTPKLAEKWEQPDPATYLFTVRPGVKFHNGSTLTAEDVAYSYGRWNELGANPNTAALSRDVKSIDAIDAKTFRAVAKKPDVDFIENFNGNVRLGTGIMPRSAATAGVDFKKTVVGTGPFRLQRYQADGTALAVRFDEYWQAGRPYLDGIHLVMGADDATISAAFIAREVDAVTRPDRLQADPIRKAVPDAEVVTWAGDNVYGLSLNVGRAPYSDVRVRRALHLALDRPGIEALVSFGDGLISGPLIIERAGYTMTHAELLAQPGYRTPKDADIAEALKLLDAAGYKGGFKAEFMSNPATAAATGAFAEAIQAQLKKTLSIDTRLVPVEGAAFTARRNTSGDFDLVIELPAGVARPGVRVQSIYSTNAAPKAAGWKDTELDSLIDAQRLEFDDKARGAIFQKIERKLLDLAWFLGISAGPYFGLRQPWVRDYRDNRARITALTNPSWVWLDLNKAPANRKSQPAS